MNATMTREQQIELMKTAKDRHEARAKIWLKDPAVRRALTEPVRDGQTQGRRTKRSGN